MSTKGKILYAEDELGLSMAVSEILKMEGFEVTAVMDGLAADEVLQKEHFDIAILDIMMPGMEGTEVARNMRDREDYTPVLLLTAKAETEDRIEGLNMGADDYLAKPFAMGELVARVKAMVRRNKEYQQTVLNLANVTLDLESNELSAKIRQFDIERQRSKAPCFIFGKGKCQLFQRRNCKTSISGRS